MARADHRGRSVRRRSLATMAVAVGMDQSEMALRRRGRGAIPVGIHGFRFNPRRESGSLASVARRREAHGIGLLHRRRPFFRPAAIRSLVQRRLSQLLLLGLFYSVHSYAPHCHPACRRFQPCGAPVVRPHRHRSRRVGVQHGGGGPPARFSTDRRGCPQPNGVSSVVILAGVGNPLAGSAVAVALPLAYHGGRRRRDHRSDDGGGGRQFGRDGPAFRHGGGENTRDAGAAFRL